MSVFLLYYTFVYEFGYSTHLFYLCYVSNIVRPIYYFMIIKRTFKIRSIKIKIIFNSIYHYYFMLKFLNFQE